MFIPVIPDPGDSRPALLIGGSDRIAITHLNGTGLKPLRSLGVNGTLALDFQHKQESVCWVLSTESSGQLRCAETRNLRGFTREHEIRTQQSLQRTFSAVHAFLFSHTSLSSLLWFFLKDYLNSHLRIEDSGAFSSGNTDDSKLSHKPSLLLLFLSLFS